MHDEGRDLGSLFMELPAEIRIDIYERVFNASLENGLLPSPLESSPMQKVMLRTLHINRAIRNESQDTCTKLAKHHIEELEASIEAGNVTCIEISDIGVVLPPSATSPHSQPYWERFERLEGLAEGISYDTNKLMAFYGLLRALHVPHGGRINIPRLEVLRRLHLLFQDNMERLVQIVENEKHQGSSGGGGA